ncbi:hypothetical protein BURCENK562V_C3303 [Burkholderia cenocepacia K56-2Valvano]|nr:hypothetical protein BURCENK562V_C3303 [Burkholderia cenocepacia K56-2Valvano]
MRRGRIACHRTVVRYPANPARIFCIQRTFRGDGLCDTPTVPVVPAAPGGPKGFMSLRRHPPRRQQIKASETSHVFITHPRSRPAFARPHRRRSRRADPSRHDRRHERLHRVGLSEGRAGRARRPHRCGARARRELPDQRADGRVDRPGTRRRARPHRRHLDAAAVPVRPDVARQDQRRRSRLPGRPPEPRRAICMVRAVRRSRRRDRRSRGHPRGRPADPVRVDRQQQDLARAREARDPRSERAPAARPRRDARHLLRHRAAAASQADSADEERRPDRRAVPALPGRQDRRDRRDRRARSQQCIHRAGCDVQADRAATDRLPASRSEARPPAGKPAAAAVGRRQHHERGARGTQLGRFLEPDGLHRGDPGRHARPARRRHAELRVGHRAVAEPGRRAAFRRRDRDVPREDRAASAGDQQPSGARAPPRLHRDERDDRSRHLRQRELDARDGHEDPERHRRLGRLRAQRLPVVLHVGEYREGRGDLADRADGEPRRPYRARRRGRRHRAGAGRPARPVAEAARARSSRPARTPTTVRCSRTTSSARRATASASTRRICSPRRCRGTSATCAPGR